MAKATNLTSRWKSAVVKEADRVLYVSPLGPTTAIPKVGTIDVDGTTYLDLRGYPFAAVFKELALDRVDFSSCKLDGPRGFARVTASKCRFLDATLEGSISGTFTECQFDRAVLPRWIGWPETRFVRCTFDGASFRGGCLEGSTFTDCSLRDCKVSRTEFLKCRFDGCDFTGAVFKEASLARSVIAGPKNNFRYADPNDYQVKHEFVVDPGLPTIDLDETSTVGTAFRVRRGKPS
jgi:uncharacterized protein YjbI with pentapeptide repeats